MKNGEGIYTPCADFLDPQTQTYSSLPFVTFLPR